MLGFELSDEQKALCDTARKFGRDEILPVAAKCDEHEEFPVEVFRRAHEIGLCNVEVPAEYGGLGVGCLEHVLILEELNYACCGITTSLGGTALGTLPLLVAGDDEQKKKWLGWVVREPVFAAYACSEPDAGSDVAAIKTRLRKVGDEYELTGQKRWITNGGLAHFYTGFATLDPAMRHKGITAFVVERERPGIKVGRKEVKLGHRASNTTDVIFEEVKITGADVIGEEGQGFKIAMRCFDRSRPWIAAGAAGLIRRCIDESRRYALERKTFGIPIAQHQAIQFMLAEMAIAYETTRLLTHKAAWMVDQGKLDSIVSSYAKGYGADAAMRSAIDAVQIFGGYGYTKEYPVEKLMRDAKLLQIYEGTSQIQRMVIARRMLEGGA